MKNRFAMAAPSGAVGWAVSGLILIGIVCAIGVFFGARSK